MMFFAGVLEIIAVVVFLALVLDLLGGSSGDQVAVLELIGILILLAWLAKKIDKGVHIPDLILGLFLRPLLEAPIAGSVRHRRIEPDDFCLGHRRSVLVAGYAILVVALPMVVILAMYTLAEGSPVTATVWKWTYLCVISIMGICFTWMIGTIFHARRWRCVKEVV